MTNWIRGSDLPKYLQEEAKRRYVHRFTGEHRPEWARDPAVYWAQFNDDAEWLAHTFFAVVNDHSKFDERQSHCESYPTWPLHGKRRP